MKSLTVVTPLNRPEAAAWSEARARVESYLRAHRLTNPRQIARLASDIVGIARARQRPGVEPVTVAMETVDACMGAWFARMADTDDANVAHRLVRGRLALTLGDVPARWPEHFLRERAAPAELVNTMRTAIPGRGPAVQLGHMVPEAGAPATVSRPRWQTAYRRWAFLRALAGAMMVLSLIGAALAAGL